MLDIVAWVESSLEMFHFFPEELAADQIMFPISNMLLSSAYLLFFSLAFRYLYDVSGHGFFGSVLLGVS